MRPPRTIGAKSLTSRVSGDACIARRTMRPGADFTASSVGTPARGGRPGDERLKPATPQQNYVMLPGMKQRIEMPR
jgi:hypothetical protein